MKAMVDVLLKIVTTLCAEAGSVLCVFLGSYIFWHKVTHWSVYTCPSTKVETNVTLNKTLLTLLIIQPFDNLLAQTDEQHRLNTYLDAENIINVNASH